MMRRREIPHAVLFALVIAGFFALAVVPLHAQADSGRGRGAVVIETDPLAIILGGGSVHGGYSFPSRRISLGISAVAGLNLPAFVINADERNAGVPWQAKINQGAGLWVHYHLSPEANHWFAGLQLFTQELNLSRDDFPGEIDRTNLAMVALQFGYRWSPFHRSESFLNRLYIRPWVGAGYQWKIRGTFEPGEVTYSTAIAGAEYHVAGFMPFASVHIGFKLF
jgi:hypothetical protein